MLTNWTTWVTMWRKIVLLGLTNKIWSEQYPQTLFVLAVSLEIAMCLGPPFSFPLRNTPFGCLWPSRKRFTVDWGYAHKCGVVMCEWLIWTRQRRRQNKQKPPRAAKMRLIFSFLYTIFPGIWLSDCVRMRRRIMGFVRIIKCGLCEWCAFDAVWAEHSGEQIFKMESIRCGIAKCEWRS